MTSQFCGTTPNTFSMEIYPGEENCVTKSFATRKTDLEEQKKGKKAARMTTTKTATTVEKAKKKKKNVWRPNRYENVKGSVC